MRSCVAILLALIVPVAPAAGDDLGVVLLHGKGGSPSGYVRELAAALRSKGHLV
jgi:predicted alpha/beta-fold hydrolase